MTDEWEWSPDEWERRREEWTVASRAAQVEWRKVVDAAVAELAERWPAVFGDIREDDPNSVNPVIVVDPPGVYELLRASGVDLPGLPPPPDWPEHPALTMRTRGVSHRPSIMGAIDDETKGTP